MGTRVDQVVEAVLTGMGRTVVRAGTESERHSDTLAGLLEVAATEQLAFLQREASLPAVKETLQGRVLPAVLWRSDAFAVVVAATDRDGLLLTIADPFGATREESCSLTEVVDRLTALGAVGAGPTLLLTPIEVEPVLGAGSTEEHGDAHPTPVQRLWQLLRHERSDIGLVYLYATLNGLIYLTL
ncbi:MAG: hypothetical protein KA226_10820, partial [Gemmatimonadales bacterium]|nr:hypothetical protein [Gemmatimonadales bacterium]